MDHSIYLYLIDRDIYQIFRNISRFTAPLYPSASSLRAKRGNPVMRRRAARGFIAGLLRRLRLSRNRKVPTIRTEAFLPPHPSPLPRGARGKRGAGGCVVWNLFVPLRERARVRGKKFVSSPSAPAPDGSGGDAHNDRSPHYANFAPPSLRAKRGNPVMKRRKAPRSHPLKPQRLNRKRRQHPGRRGANTPLFARALRDD